MTDITNTLLKETRDAMDRLGFAFLQDCGYPCNPHDKATIDAVRKQMKKDGTHLVYHCEKREDGYLLWFALLRGKKTLRRSAGLKLQYQEEKEKSESGSSLV